MNEDTHAQANAEQIRLLREALGEAALAEEAAQGVASEAMGVSSGEDAEVGIS